MPHISEEIDPTYAAACSDVTLCSSSKGFFKSLADEMVAISDVGWLQTFENVDEGKKVNAVLENKEIMDALTEVLSRIQPLHRGKDARVSYERRLAAAAALQAGDLTKALSLASQAVFRAPMTGVDEVIDSGVSLAIALWLRSEVLLKCGRPTAALEDLKMALKERLPAKMRAQYYWRMGHCYKGAGEPTRAKVSYELAGRLLGTNEEAKAQLAEDVATLDYNVQPKHPPDKTDICLTGGAKLNVPSMSKLLKISEEEHKGRFAVANSSIRTGDVLLKDSPYAACLLSDYYGSHCLHCFKRFEDCLDEAPVWCPKCSGVAFCCVKCKDTAVNTYHAYECPFLDLFLGSGMSVLTHIALRMVTQAGLNTCVSIYGKYINSNIRTVEGATLNDIEGVAKKSKIKSRRERLNRSKRGQKSFENLQEEVANKENEMSLEEKLEVKASQIYSLCTHSEQRKGGDYLKRVVMALFLTECLKKSAFFKDCEKENIQNAYIAVAELIVRNLQLLQFNAHEIYETVRGSHMFSGSKPVYIAVGIYPTGALFNHECYPAVSRYFEGRDIVLRATRPLSPGEVVSENYGPHFMTRILKDRQRSLACRYWFKCECVTCKEDWPTMKQMKSGPPYLRCPNMSCGGKFRAIPQSIPFKCSQCSTDIDKNLVRINVENVERCITLYQEGAKLMDEEKPEDAIAVMAKAIDLYHEVARGPHLETHLAQEALRSCYAINGNVHVVRTEQEEKA
ncbi:hypothetical protein K1T71_000368 [Dendrolimus kikuchii]|uniref:Uncharacterized protein n=1 Tax=Dendrolimus kikuchii TaxID=765133 RepID=A0ACC1DJ69_9NEOP|nr:hypothetical protein K1T71_000368 [Dendrolimus kikuchii]